MVICTQGMCEPHVQFLCGLQRASSLNFYFKHVHESLHHLDLVLFLPAFQACELIVQINF